MATEKHLTPSTVYLPVSVQEEMPKKDGFYYVIYDNGRGGNNWLRDGKWFDEVMGAKKSEVAYWLKELPEQYVFSKEELVKLVDELISEALHYGYHTAKQEAEGIASGGYGTRFRNQPHIKQLIQ